MDDDDDNDDDDDDDDDDGGGSDGGDGGTDIDDDNDGREEGLTTEKEMLVRYVDCQPNSVKQSSSWATNNFTAAQEIACVYSNPNIYHHIYKNLRVFLSLSQRSQTVPFHPL